MSSRQPNTGLAVLSVVIFTQVVCFFLDAVDNFFANFRLTFMGAKGAALAQPVVHLHGLAAIGQTLTWFYLICCLIFLLLPIGLLRYKPAFFYLLLILDTISLCLGLYGYYFWAHGDADLTSMERLITLIEPFLSSGGLVLLIAVPAIRKIWWPSQS